MATRKGGRKGAAKRGAKALGIDLVHFGLVMVLNLMIGLLHPPMGMVLFVLARVAGGYRFQSHPALAAYVVDAETGAIVRATGG